MKKIIMAVPVYNEEKILKDSIEKLYNYFKENVKYDWLIVIANNASTDKTRVIGEKLSKKYKRVKIINIDLKGRGNALKRAWTSFKADCYIYSDCDLATDISHIKGLIDSVLDENYNISSGNRYLKDSKTKRKPDRWIYSKAYILLVKLFFRTKLSDFQCGFKAVDKKIVHELLLNIEDNEWFFDTELLLKAESLGYKIKEIPVKWCEMRVKESKVNRIDTVIKYIINLINFKKRDSGVHSNS